VSIQEVSCLTASNLFSCTGALPFQLQTVTTVGVFVASGGNLAASYVANVANQIIFSILQERCSQRAKEVRAGMCVGHKDGSFCFLC